MTPCPICKKKWVEHTCQSMVAAELDSFAVTVHFSLPFSAHNLIQTVAATFLLRECKAFNNFLWTVDAFFPRFFFFHICVIGKQHLEERRVNTVVYFWSFSLFWCGIEEWFFVSPSVAVGADTAMFFLSIIEQCVSFSEWSLLTVATSPVGSAACTCTSQRVLAAVDCDTTSCCGPFLPGC